MKIITIIMPLSLLIGNLLFMMLCSSCSETNPPYVSQEKVNVSDSTSKMYTATLVVKAVEQGKIDLSDHLSKWFPEVPDAEQITVTQLLNHTSGLAEILESFSPKMEFYCRMISKIRFCFPWNKHQIGW